MVNSNSTSSGKETRQTVKIHPVDVSSSQKKTYKTILNEAANVLTTSLSNQMISLRHIKTWRYDVVFVYENISSISLFHQDDQLISRISNPVMDNTRCFSD